jgi:CPA1 family monovalent cation:H+ antiporter
MLEPGERVCAECVEEGLEWVALHLCTSCGHVGCCISSPGGHAKKHHLATGHPVIRSTEHGWFWCYPDKRYTEPVA